MCMSSPKTPPPPPPAAKPAVIADVEDMAPKLDIDSNSKLQSRKRRGKRAFKQTTNVTGISAPTGGAGLSIPK